MAYDLLIKNGRIVDGSGMPAFRGGVGVKYGKIVELGKLSGPAKRTIDAEGRVVAPGFVDNHCHYDAQVTWDPLARSHPIMAPRPWSSGIAHCPWPRFVAAPRSGLPSSSPMS